MNSNTVTAKAIITIKADVTASIFT
jgi:hypothetical protein